MPPPVVPLEDDDVLMNDWSPIKLVEEFDPRDLGAVSRPYAFVADHVVRVDLSVSVAEEIARYEERMAREKGGAGPAMTTGGSSDDYGRTTHKKNTGTGKKAGWFEKLRDQLQRGEDIRWYVIVCGDEDREIEEVEDVVRMDSQQRNQHSTAKQRSVSGSRERSASTAAGGGYATGGSRRDRSTSASQDRGPVLPALPFESPSLRTPSSAATTQFSSRDLAPSQPTHRNQFSTSTTSSSQQGYRGEFGAPTLRPKPSTEATPRPKTPKSGGLRRLFGRKHDDVASP
jgi:hypothetical protein